MSRLFQPKFRLLGQLAKLEDVKIEFFFQIVTQFSPIMMFAGQHKILGSRGSHQLGPLCRIEEMCRELGPEFLVLEIGGEVLIHVVHDLHVPGIIRVTTVPLIPEPLKSYH